MANTRKMTNRHSIETKDRRLGMILVLPIVVVMLLLVLYPLVNLCILCFQKLQYVNRIGNFCGT